MSQGVEAGDVGPPGAVGEAAAGPGVSAVSGGDEVAAGVAGRAGMDMERAVVSAEVAVVVGAVSLAIVATVWVLEVVVVAESVAAEDGVSAGPDGDARMSLAL